MLLTADVVALVGAYGVSRLLSAHGQPLDLADLFPVVAALLWAPIAMAAGLDSPHGRRTDHSIADELGRVMAILMAGAWVYLLLAWAAGPSRVDPTGPVLWWALAGILVTTARVIVRAVVRRSGRGRCNTVIVGAGDVGQMIGRKIQQHPEYGIDLLGFVDEAPRAKRPDLERLTVLGASDRLPEIVRSLGVDRVIVAFSGQPAERTLALLRSPACSGVRIDVVPRLFEALGPQVLLDRMESLSLLEMSPPRRTRGARVAKRIVDVAVASVALVALAPVLALIAVLIKLESPGPALFRQTRLGEAMRTFTSLKFRTMVVGTGEEVHRAYIESMMARPVPPQNGGLFKLSRDEEITGIGRWLRRTSLDELPQLFNVLRGDMSLVGPRPCIPYETELFRPHHFERFHVPAGLTGLWQVSARARSTFPEALDMDVAYARAASLRLDLGILLRTPGELFRAKATR